MIHLVKYATAVATDSEIVSSSAFPQRVHYCADTYKGVKTGLKYPAHLMAEKVMTPEIVEYLKTATGKTAFILAAGNTTFAGARNTIGNWNAYEYRFLPLTLTQVFAGRMAQRCNATDMVVTDSSACASSLKVLMDAQTLIKMYGFDRVVVLATEDQVNDTTLKFFGEMQATVSEAQELAGQKASAFDDTNFGFNIAQGSVLAVFEAEPSEGSVAMLGAYSCAEKLDNAVGQREDGEGFFTSASEALKLARVSSPNVTVVKTHGTGTKSNNVAEKAAISRLLGDSGYVATSFKPDIGHTFGASGLLESCLLFDSIKTTGVVPAIKNRTGVDSVYLSHAVKKPDGDILSLAAGMGNIYAAAVWRLL